MGLAQIYNTDVEANIETENNNEFIKITGTALNKSEINQSFRYILSVIKTNPGNTNRSKSDQTGRNVLKSGEKAELSSTTINSDNRDRIIILLLIYDNDDSLIGKDRIVFNGGKLVETDNEDYIESENTTEDSLKDEEEDVDSGMKDGIELKGIVVEDTKTKPGRDFYTMFYSAYNTSNINGKKIVTIREVLALGRNTKIEVKVGDEVVLDFFVRPKNEYLKAMRDVALRKVFSYFQKLKREKEIIKHY
jgi:hypothetical protein|tara:strand:- start:63285 stop:64031 length:747 start_codon:yes stop_codon:yes gene_type:complete